MNHCKLESGMKFISKLNEEVVLFNDFDGGRFEIWTPSTHTNPLAHLVTIEGKKYNFLCADLTLDLAIEKLRERKSVKKYNMMLAASLVRATFLFLVIFLLSTAITFSLIEAFFK